MKIILKKKGNIPIPLKKRDWKQTITNKLTNQNSIFKGRSARVKASMLACLNRIYMVCHSEENSKDKQTLFQVSLNSLKYLNEHNS